VFVIAAILADTGEDSATQMPRKAATAPPSLGNSTDRRAKVIGFLKNRWLMISANPFLLQRRWLLRANACRLRKKIRGAITRVVPLTMNTAAQELPMAMISGLSSSPRSGEA